MKTKLFFLSLTVLIIINMSCNNSPTQTDELPSSDFPNKVGDTWTYFHFDSLNLKSDTVVVTIVGQTTLASNQLATIWQFKSWQGVETTYVTVSKDTVRLISSSHGFKLIFPLQVGNKWKEDYSANDTNRVLRSGSISVIAGNFSGTYELQESWGFLNDYGSISRWFVPQVGIVRIYHTRWSFGMANETFELVRYKIN